MPDGWNVMQIKAQTAFSNVQDVKNWIWGLIGDATLFWSVDDTKQALGLNNTKDYAMIALQVIRPNTDSSSINTGSYLRYANGAYNTNTNLSLSYSLFVDIGDDITIYYK